MESVPIATVTESTPVSQGQFVSPNSRWRPQKTLW